MKLVIFEGCDRSGKTTLARAFNKATNFRHLVVDRLFVSQVVYARIFGRRVDMSDLKRMFQANRSDILIVHVDASISDIQKRLKETNHEGFDILAHQIQFNEAMKVFQDELGANVCYVHTSSMSTEDNVNRIIKKIHEMETAL